MTLESQKPFPVLQPSDYKTENYSLLTDKVFRTLKYVYKAYGNYDWYLKADDDTFIFMDHLRLFLKDKNPRDPINFGHNWNAQVEQGYESGGAGYILSNEALKRIGSVLNDNYSFCQNTGTEDIDVARCLRKLKVYPINTIDDDKRPRFHAYSIMDRYRSHVSTIN